MWATFIYPYTFQCPSPLIRSNSSTNLPHHHWSVALPFEDSCFNQPAPHFHRPMHSLHRPQRSGQRPEAMVKSYWSPEVRVHTGAALPGVKGQIWVGQVRLNVPALLPGAMKVSSAQFILWPRLVNSGSRPSIELWFVIKFFNSSAAHIIPLKIEEWPYRCTWYFLGLILDGNHLDLQAGCWQGIGLCQ